MKRRWAVYAGLGAMLGMGANAGAHGLEGVKAQSGAAFGEDGGGLARESSPVFASASHFPRGDRDHHEDAWGRETYAQPLHRRDDRVERWPSRDRHEERRRDRNTRLLVGGALAGAILVGGMASCARSANAAPSQNGGSYSAGTR